MDKIFVNFLPPWVETNIQPAFYDKESGSVLQQTARMYAKVQCLVRMFNKLSKETKETVEEYITKFVELKDFVDTYFENLDVQDEINNKLDKMVEDGTLQSLLANYLVICGGNAKELGAVGDGVTDDTTALQNAINQMKTLNINKLVLPAGEYVISGVITIPSDFELLGMEGSVLKYVGQGIEGDILKIQGTDADSPAKNIIIRNVTIDGTDQEYKGGNTMQTPKATHTDPCYRGMMAIRVVFAQNVLIEGCTINDIYGEGIGISRSFDVRIRDNKLYSVGSGNIQYDGQTGYDNHGDAIRAFYSFNVIFENNTVVNKRVYLAGIASAIGKPCGRSGLEFEYPLNQDYPNDNPDDPSYNAPEYSLIEKVTDDDKEYRDQYSSIAQNNFVRGYTKAIHIESNVKCNLIGNTMLYCHIGIMYSTYAGGTISGNMFNPMGVGVAPQSGYNEYNAGIAVSQYGANDSKYGVIVSNNTVIGNCKGVIVGTNNVIVTSNIFKCTNGVYTILANLFGIVVSNNTFNDKYVTERGSMLYLYNVAGAKIDHNIIYSENGSTTNISGNNITVSNNYFRNICLNHSAGGENISLINNVFNATDSSKDYIVYLANLKNSLIDNNEFHLDDEAMNSKQAIRTYGAVDHTTYTNNKFYLNATRSNTSVINSDNITYCKYINNICKNDASDTRFIHFYTCRQCVFKHNAVASDIGTVVNGTGYRGWNIVEHNTGKIAGSVMPNDGLGEFVNLHFNKSDKFYKFNINSSSTNIGWICTLSGYYVTESWTSDSSYNAGKMIKNASNNVYKLITKGSGNSNVEPTHTTETEVTESDGYKWLYLGAVATFKDLTV